MKTQRITEEAVKKATGKDWAGWIKELDKLGGVRLPHKNLTELLYKKFKIDGWWGQAVAMGYESAKGKRLTGKTEKVGFQIGVTKTLPISAQKAWKIVTSTDGIKYWLGSTPSISLQPGATFQTEEGTTGEIRTIHPGSKIRLTWKPRGAEEHSTLQVSVIPRATTNGTCIGFHHENLKSNAERTAMRSHWKGVLNNLGKLG